MPPSAADDDAPVRATLYDGFSTKKALDDSLVKLLGRAPDVPEDHAWGNVKLAVMAVACASALLAQFYPLPFPASRPLLAACVAVYFALSGVYQAVTTFVDRDAVFFGARGPGGRPPCVVRARMGKYESVYRLVAECPPGRVVGAGDAGVGELIDAEGAVVEAALQALLDRAVLPGIRAAAAGADKKAR